MDTLRAGNLLLEPLRAAHAPAMFAVLSDPALYRFLDDAPPLSLEHLRERYARLESRRSPDGRQAWLNWVIRPDAGEPAGFVQATVTAGGAAWVAYLLAAGHQGRGHATQATRAVIDHLAGSRGVQRFLAIVEAENRASIRLLERLGFRPEDAAGHDLSPTERLFALHVSPAP